MRGKVCLITGASRGLGRALALEFGRYGAKLIINSRSSSENDLMEVELQLREMGAQVLSVVADVSSRADVERLAAEALARFGHVDVLVNNAGIIRRAPALEFSEADWDDVLHINLKAAFFLSQAVARELVKQGGGKIINIASMLSFQGGIIVPSYTAAKSGLAGITRALANEWAKYHINVNAIAPGYMATANTAALRADADRSTAILDRIPAGRWGTPIDLQGIAVFLASPASDYVQGAIVPVDGGWLAR